MSIRRFIPPSFKGFRFLVEYLSLPSSIHASSFRISRVVPAMDLPFRLKDESDIKRGLDAYFSDLHELVTGTNSEEGYLLLVDVEPTSSVEQRFSLHIVGRRQVGTSRPRAKQVPVAGCLPGPISIFFMQTSSLKPYVPNVILEKIIIDLEDEVECDEEENPKVIAPGMFKLNVSQCVSQISMSKSSCDSNNVEIKLKRKRHKRKSSKQNKKKGSSNTSNVGLSAVSVSNLNKNVKRYSRKDLLACNNSNLGETRSAFVYNNAMNFSCDSRMNDLLDDNNFFIFDDESVKIFPVSKMPFRKKPRDSMNVRSKSTMNKYLPRTMHKWLPKLQPLAKPVAKWFPRVKRQIDKISKTPNSPGTIYKKVKDSF
nr:hypothetical protein [Tanacetum cinerariifolium]